MRLLGEDSAKAVDAAFMVASQILSVDERIAGESIGKDPSQHPDNDDEHGAHLPERIAELREGRGDIQACSGWVREVAGKKTCGHEEMCKKSGNSTRRSFEGQREDKRAPQGISTLDDSKHFGCSTSRIKANEVRGEAKGDKRKQTL